MTKAEVVEMFKTEVLPGIKATELRQGGSKDWPLRAECWSSWTDALCKQRKITLLQYETWDTPGFLISPEERRKRREPAVREHRERPEKVKPEKKRESGHIVHMPKLLQDISLDLGKFCYIPGGKNPGLECLEVTFFTEAGEKYAFDVPGALNVLANDLFWDERGNWANAYRAEVNVT